MPHLPKARLAVAIAGLVMFLCAPVMAQTIPLGPSVEPIPIKTEILIPQSGPLPYDPGYTDGKVADLANYIDVIYRFLISIVGLVAAVMMIIGGFQYLTAAGDSGKIGEARKRITDALIGLVLALSAYALLNTINPALLTFSPINALISQNLIKTEVTFVPFCDQLEKQVKQAPKPMPFEGNPNGDKSCGSPGAVVTQVKGADGSVTESRVWCVFREYRYADSRYAQGGCGGRSQYDQDGDFFEQPEVCMPIAGVTAKAMEEKFVSTKLAPKQAELAKCQSCMHLTLDKTIEHNLSGGKACAVWMNLANNGDPNDNRFALSTKSDTKFFLDKQDENTKQHMYYCGWSTVYSRCVMVNLDCPDTPTCKSYNNENIKFCTKDEYNCKDKDLHTTFRGSYGKHLGPICAANPCGSAGKCNTGVIAQVSSSIGGGDGVSVLVRGATFGLFDNGDCE